LSLIVSWVLFPVLMAAIGAGWGVAVERAAGQRAGVLLIPLGLAAALVAASLLTAWSVTAPAATPLVGVVAVVGLLAGQPFRRLALWPSLAALGVLLVYGAPILLSGSATFAGYLRLDDTASWLALTDHVMSHGRSLADLPSSTYSAVVEEYVTNNYPLGGFMLLGAGHGLSGIDSAWIYQPYLACCGAAVGLGIYALIEPVVQSPRLRALVAFLAAQPALLYGYAMWGGIKELTAAFLLVLGAALFARVITSRAESPRRLLPLAIAGAGLIVTLGAGAAAWVVPSLIGLVIAWVVRARHGELRGVARDVALLSVTTAVLALPMWVVLRSFLGHDSNLFSSGQPVSEQLGNLLQPLSGWQLAGIWPVGDFRLRAPTLATVLLIALAVLAAGVAIFWTVRRRQYTVLAYVALALVGCAVFYLVGSTPWVIGKTLAIASPALLAAALVGGVLLWLRWRAGLLVLLAIAGGVLWSNVLAYRDVTLAPRARLAELAHIGGRVAGEGPTFINEFEAYAARHFLRRSAPIEPAQYRPAELPLRDGVLLTKSAWADLDSFPLSTLEPYRTIITRRSPAESRPPSIYRPVWQGRYYQVWQRAPHAQRSLLEHIPLGESNTLPFCGNAQNAPARELCSTDPVAVPPCAQVQRLAVQALGEHAQLLAYQRPRPIVLRGDEVRWPGPWLHDEASRTLTATSPGKAEGQMSVPHAQRYELWLDGNFSRGFEVAVDGRRVGSVKDELSGFSAYVHIANLFLAAGAHTVELTYPHPNLTAGNAENELTSISAITLQPQMPAGELVEVAPQQYSRLCGRTLDWIELVRRSS
jgi:hypothetical protein